MADNRREVYYKNVKISFNACREEEIMALLVFDSCSTIDGLARWGSLCHLASSKEASTLDALDRCVLLRHTHNKSKRK